MKASLLSLLVVGLGACGGQVAQPIDGGTATDANTQDAPPHPTPNDAAPPVVDASKECNTLTPIASKITPQQVASDLPPAASDPTLPFAATYEMESATVYTGKNGGVGAADPISVTLRIAADTTHWETVSIDGQGTTRSTFTLVKQGPGWVLTPTCGKGQPTPVAFIPINSPGFVMQAQAGNIGSRSVFRPFTK
ncbi:hypothetical protein BH09MYX1_BH09MYX1_32010 [soil metagenome]